LTSTQPNFFLIYGLKPAFYRCTSASRATIQHDQHCFRAIAESFVYYGFDADVIKNRTYLGSTPKSYVFEWEDDFLSLFPHRYDYIYASHPDPGERPTWKTESRYPLSDRLIQQGTYLYGVRFGATTQYSLIDIDATSIYHPKRDRFAVSRMLSALEPLGLVQYVPITSSYSGGIHLYFPFETPQPTWDIAIAIQCLLESAGFVLKPGQLEVFPNAKFFTSDGYSLYAAHRLPMQAGSYLLSEDWQITYSTQSEFVRQWRYAQRRNDVNAKSLSRTIKRAVRKRYRITVKASQFLNDLNTEVESGWTSHGQTNYLLGRIAMREYIFGHVLRGGSPLTGDALVEAIAQVARSLPGYEEWCRHQQEIEEKARDWVRCIENSRYYPYGAKSLSSSPSSPPSLPDEPTWNEKQSLAARDRIRGAIADLLNQGILPAQITARKNAIKGYGVGSTTLDKHQDLWHPNHLKPLPEEEYHPIPTDISSTESLKPLPEEEYHPIGGISLGGSGMADAPSEQSKPCPHLNDVGGRGGFSTGLGDGVVDSFATSPIEAGESAEIASSEDGNRALLEGEQPTLAAQEEVLPPSGAAFVRTVLEQIKQRQQQRRQLTLFEDSPPPDEHYFGAAIRDGCSDKS
jgi:hypothetical protein